MTVAYIGIGSNVGDRVENLRQALKYLDGIMSQERLSATYETAPRYVLDQPPFLNMAVGGDTPLEPLLLLKQLKKFEIDIGRVPTEERYGPRAIDLDILFYGSEVVNEPGLSIPHSLMAEREFVLRPLADIAPNFQHPVLGHSVAEMLALLEGEPEAQMVTIDV